MSEATCFFFTPCPFVKLFKCWLLFTISYSKVLWSDLIPDIESDSFSLHCQQIVTDEEMRWRKMRWELGSASCQKVRASENLRNFSIKFRRIQTHQPCNDQTHHKKDLFTTVCIPRGWTSNCLYIHDNHRETFLTWATPHRAGSQRTSGTVQRQPRARGPLLDQANSGLRLLWKHVSFITASHRIHSSGALVIVRLLRAGRKALD